MPLAFPGLGVLAEILLWPWPVCKSSPYEEGDSSRSGNFSLSFEEEDLLRSVVAGAMSSVELIRARGNTFARTSTNLEV